MDKAIHIFRDDQKNVGDYWSPAFRYFNFSSTKYHDIAHLPSNIKADVAIIGGGGLGREDFSAYFTQLRKFQESGVKLIAWGVGSDILVSHTTIREPNTDLAGKYFDFFDEVGIRIYGTKFRWVPCASCMHDAFEKLREKKPSKLIGIYSHKRIPLTNNKLHSLFFKKARHITIKKTVDGSQSNNGKNILEKLTWMSEHEYIITNSYHGVYWATLLNRKVICIPSKSGLYTFKHKPTYGNSIVDQALLNQATSYPNALEDCRNANISYYNYLKSKFENI